MVPGSACRRLGRLSVQFGAEAGEARLKVDDEPLDGRRQLRADQHRTVVGALLRQLVADFAFHLHFNFLILIILYSYFSHI